MTAWRKSSHCLPDANGCHANGTCIELAWYSASTSGNCVEVAGTSDIAIRDSKNPNRAHLHLTQGTFAAFTHGLKAAG